MFCAEYWRIDETQIPTNAKCDILPYSLLTGTHLQLYMGFKALSKLTWYFWIRCVRILFETWQISIK